MIEKKSEILYDSNKYSDKKKKSSKLFYSILIINIFAIIVLFYYIFLLLFTIKFVITPLVILILFAALLALIFFILLEFVGIVIIMKKFFILLTDTNFIYKTPFNSIPLMHKNQNIQYKQIKYVFSNELNRFPSIFIALKNKKTFPILKTNIPNFDIFIKILKSKVKIISDGHWNYMKVRNYIKNNNQ